MRANSVSAFPGGESLSDDVTILYLIKERLPVFVSDRVRVKLVHTDPARGFIDFARS